MDEVELGGSVERRSLGQLLMGHKEESRESSNGKVNLFNQRKLTLRGSVERIPEKEVWSNHEIWLCIRIDGLKHRELWLRELVAMTETMIDKNDQSYGDKAIHEKRASARTIQAEARSDHGCARLEGVTSHVSKATKIAMTKMAVTEKEQTMRPTRKGKDQDLAVQRKAIHITQTSTCAHLEGVKREEKGRRSVEEATELVGLMRQRGESHCTHGTMHGPLVHGECPMSTPFVVPKAHVTPLHPKEERRCTRSKSQPKDSYISS